MAAVISLLPSFLLGDRAFSIVIPRRVVFRPCGVPLRRWVAAADASGNRRLRGITKPRPISPELQAVVGEAEIPRTQALKKIWAYIKENNLQDPEDKRVILCDEKLKNIFRRDRVGFLEISGLLNPHFIKTLSKIAGFPAIHSLVLEGMFSYQVPGEFNHLREVDVPSSLLTSDV